MKELRDLAGSCSPTARSTSSSAGRTARAARGRSSSPTPEDAEQLIFDTRCVHNLATYLNPRRKHVTELGKLAVVVKGCDARAVAGLLREAQLKRDDVVLIGVRCGGVCEDSMAPRAGRAHARDRGAALPRLRQPRAAPRRPPRRRAASPSRRRRCSRSTSASRRSRRSRPSSAGRSGRRSSTSACAATPAARSARCASASAASPTRPSRSGSRPPRTRAATSPGTSRAPCTSPAAASAAASASASARRASRWPAQPQAAAGRRGALRLPRRRRPRGRRPRSATSASTTSRSSSSERRRCTRHEAP